MTITDMHLAIKLELDKTSALELPSFEPEEIDFWLNNAIRKFVKTRYSGSNLKRTSVEETQKRTDDLRTVTVHSQYLPSIYTGSYPNGTVFDIPSDYWFALQEEADIQISGVTSRVGITECTSDEYSTMLEDPFSEHKVHYGLAKPLRLFNNTQVELINDGTYNVSTYYLTYIKKPAEVQIIVPAVDCDLPEHTHDEIVKMTANMMLENIEQPRYKTHMAEVATME